MTPWSKMLGLVIPLLLYSSNIFLSWYTVAVLTKKKILSDYPFKSIQRPAKLSILTPRWVSILTPRCHSHSGVWLAGGVIHIAEFLEKFCLLDSAESFPPRNSLKIWKFRRNRNIILKYLTRLSGDQMDSNHKKIDVENLVTHSLTESQSQASKSEMQVSAK